MTNVIRVNNIYMLFNLQIATIFPVSDKLKSYKQSHLYTFYIRRLKEVKT